MSGDRLAEAHAEVLLDQRSLHYLAPSASLMVALAGGPQQVIDAFRTGGGVAYEAYGALFGEARGRATRPLSENLSMPIVHDQWRFYRLSG
jgi:hypothetical protein